ncbi:hypothetical protein KKB10_00240 [Patescibacteria group bacterium]|nr:hypothetical protein [Patescibacteria group bacterium]MBU1075489.1 hypothetical protein [Patescibacteria group bacterium]
MERFNITNDHDKIPGRLAETNEASEDSEVLKEKLAELDEMMQKMADEPEQNETSRRKFLEVFNKAAELNRRLRDTMPPEEAAKLPFRVREIVRIRRDNWDYEDGWRVVTRSHTGSFCVKNEDDIADSITTLQDELGQWHVNGRDDHPELRALNSEARTKIYEKPRDDSAYARVPEEIRSRVFEEMQVGGQREQEVAIRKRETEKAWAAFITAFPEKARWYRAFSPQLKDALMREARSTYQEQIKTAFVKYGISTEKLDDVATAVQQLRDTHPEFFQEHRLGNDASFSDVADAMGINWLKIRTEVCGEHLNHPYAPQK